jgi:prolycopene isomerase
MSGEASKAAYDVIVVGGGMGGLSAGALLARAGKRVLVVEQAERPGGYACGFERGPYTFDTAVHLVVGFNRAGPFGQGLIDAVLSHLGVQDRCEFVPADPFYRVQFPDFHLDVPPGREAFLEAHLGHFPDQAEGLRALTDLCSQIYPDTLRFPITPRLQDWLLLPIRFPSLFRHASATLGAVMDKHIADARLKAVYAALWPYLALPPSQVSILYWAWMMASYVEEGPFYCLGGFQRLPDALAEALENRGGELVLGSPVTRIRVENRVVQGVTLASGQTIDAPIVISNVDARRTFGELLEPGRVPERFLRQLSQMEPSLSVVSMYLATDLDVRALGVPIETMYYTLWDHDQVYGGGTPSQLTMVNVTIPSVTDESLAPAGEHVVALSSIHPADTGDSPGGRAQISGAMLDAAERVLPGLRDHITFVEAASEDVPEQFPLRRLGPIYGWAASPQQAGVRRLSNTTPISGLYLAGHWTQPGHGIWGVVASGVRVARLVLGKDTSEGLMPLHL